MWARGSNGEEVTRKVRVGSTMFVQISYFFASSDKNGFLPPGSREVPSHGSL